MKGDVPEAKNAISAPTSWGWPRRSNGTARDDLAPERIVDEAPPCVIHLAAEIIQCNDVGLDAEGCGFLGECFSESRGVEGGDHIITEQAQQGFPVRDSISIRT